jgi:putative colanic acid biosynthesis glycosyltransferase
MKFSIVTVSYNDCKGLQHTKSSLEGLLDNAFTDIEWIVVDGSSSDGSLEFLQGLPDYVKWISEPDSGIYDAMNKGTLLASGDFVLYLNAGDKVVSVDEFINVTNELSSSGEITMVFMGAVFVSGSQRRYRRPRPYNSIWHSIPANHQAIFFPAKYVKKLQYRDDFKICGDYDLCARIFMQSPEFRIFDFPIVEFELGGVSTYKLAPLAIEANRVQRDVLRLGFLLRALSFSRRYVAMIANLAIHELGKRF